MVMLNIGLLAVVAAFSSGHRLAQPCEPGHDRRGARGRPDGDLPGHQVPAIQLDPATIPSAAPTPPTPRTALTRRPGRAAARRRVQCEPASPRRRTTSAIGSTRTSSRWTPTAAAGEGVTVVVRELQQPDRSPMRANFHVRPSRRASRDTCSFRSLRVSVRREERFEGGNDARGRGRPPPNHQAAPTHAHAGREPCAGIILLVAPAGSGKTTLAHEWLDERRPRPGTGAVLRQQMSLRSP